VRKELGVRTFFNILGPLTNPAGAPNQLLGVFHPDLVGIQVRALQRLGAEHALVVYGKDGMDEVSLGAATLVGELKDGEITEYEIHPEDFGMVMASNRGLRVDTPEQSKAMLLAVLDNEPGPARDIVVLNAGAALYAAGVKPGSSAAVFGCGGVGDSVIQGARLGGATTIIAVDIDPQKLEWAKQFGATHTVNPKEVDAVAKIKEITGGNGANFTFEAVGKVQTLEQALWSRDLAGTCVFIGVPGPGPTLNLPLQKFFDLGGHLCVSWYGDCLPSRDFPLLADWYRQGQLKLDEVVTRTVSLDEVEEAFAAMERGETLRSVIVF
jgi:threonine dehydrogenase-like Zn-dependent dehydrogenase